MPTVDERNAAFDAAKEAIQNINPMALSFIKDRDLLAVVDQALEAAERIRARKAGPIVGDPQEPPDVP